MKNNVKFLAAIGLPPCTARLLPTVHAPSPPEANSPNPITHHPAVLSDTHLLASLAPVRSPTSLEGETTGTAAATLLLALVRPSYGCGGRRKRAT